MRTILKKAACFILPAIMILGYAWTVLAGAVITTDITFSTTEVYAGQQVLVTVTINSDTNISDADFTLVYDPNVLEFSSGDISPASYGGFANVIIHTSERTNTVLSTMTFNVKASGDTGLEVRIGSVNVYGDNTDKTVEGASTVLSIREGAPAETTPAVEETTPVVEETTPAVEETSVAGETTPQEETSSIEETTAHTAQENPTTAAGKKPTSSVKPTTATKNKTIKQKLIDYLKKHLSRKKIVSISGAVFVVFILVIVRLILENKKLKNGYDNIFTNDDNIDEYMNAQRPADDILKEEPSEVEQLKAIIEVRRQKMQEKRQTEKLEREARNERIRVSQEKEKEKIKDMKESLQKQMKADKEKTRKQKVRMAQKALEEAQTEKVEITRKKKAEKPKKVEKATDAEQKAKQEDVKKKVERTKKAAPKKKTDDNEDFF